MPLECTALTTASNYAQKVATTPAGTSLGALQAVTALPACSAAVSLLLQTLAPGKTVFWPRALTELFWTSVTAWYREFIMVVGDTARRRGQE